MAFLINISAACVARRHLQQRMYNIVSEAKNFMFRIPTSSNHKPMFRWSGMNQLNMIIYKIQPLPLL